MKRIPFARARRPRRLHQHDYIAAYVADLGNVVDLDAIRGAGVKVGVDPLGGAGSPLLGRIIEVRDQRSPW